MSGDLQTAALEYAARGWFVFPLKPGCKEPLRSDSWKSIATRDAATILAWWDDTPTANVAVA